MFAVTEEGTISLGAESDRADETTHKLNLTLAAGVDQLTSKRA